MLKNRRRYLIVMLSIVLVSSLLLGSMTASATAAKVVTDPVLNKIIHLKLGLPDTHELTADDLSKITSLAYSGYAASVSKKIKDLNGLQYATNMTLLDVTDCNVSSLGPIANLQALTTLVIRNNPVDLRTGSVDYYIVQALKARGCSVAYNTPKPSPYLIGLKTSIGALNPMFTAGVFSFKLTLSDTYSGRYVTITPIKADPAAKMWINGHSVKAYTIYVSIGSTKTVTVKVTAKDKSASKTYKITITRPSSNNMLSAIRKSTGTLTPSFKSGTSTYVLALKASVSKVTITPVKANSHARILINGASKKSIVVKIGHGATSTVTITVVAQSGAQRKYTIMVCRP